MLASIYRAAIPKCFFYDFMTFLLISMTFWGIVLILCHVAEKWELRKHLIFVCSISCYTITK